MNVLPFLLQSLQTDAYDHYSAIYSLLADRLKKHKTLRVAQPTLRPISYPLNAVQVIHYLLVLSWYVGSADISDIIAIQLKGSV